jgi:hypothetical protein
MQEIKVFDMDVYEQEKTKEKIIECVKCKNTFPLKDIDFLTSTNKNENDEVLKTTFFICPHCNEIYFVLMIDKRAETYLQQIKLYQFKIDQRKKFGRKYDVRLENKLKKIKSDFIAYQKFLIKKYGSSFTLKKDLINKTVKSEI